MGGPTPGSRLVHQHTAPKDTGLVQGGPAICLVEGKICPSSRLTTPKKVPRRLHCGPVHDHVQGVCDEGL
jgi:hypothetical protein